MMMQKKQTGKNLEPELAKKLPEEPRQGLGLLAQVTTLAWDLVVPIVGGVLLGEYLDRRMESGLTWTLALLVIGVMIAFGNLYNLYVEYGRKALQGQKSLVPVDQENDGQEE